MFNKVLLFYLLLHFLFACNDNTPSLSSSKEKVQDTVLKKYNLDSTTIEQDFPLNEQNLTRPTGKKFVGNIDDQYAIELFFQRTKSSPLKEQNISGFYQYLSMQSPILLDGKIYMKEQKIILTHQKKNLVDERFEGTFTPNFKVIKGTWTKTSKNQMLNFELQNLMNQDNTALFLEALSSILSEDAEAPSVEDVGWDETGIYLKNLHGRHLDYSFFPDSFSANSWYSSTARNSSYEIDVYLKKLAFNNKYIAIVKDYHSTEYFEHGKDKDEAPEVTTEINYSVWMNLNDTIVNIFVEKEYNAQYPICATLKEKQLTIIDQISKKEQKIL